MVRVNLFDDIMEVYNIYSGDILLDQISYHIILGEKPLCIWFDKINGVIKIDNVIIYLDIRQFDNITLIIFFQEQKLIDILIYLF